MQTPDCKALTRFKKQLLALKKGQTTATTKETYHFPQQPILPVQLTEKQYQTCTNKLQKAGITHDELTLFCDFNNQTYLSSY